MRQHFWLQMRLQTGQHISRLEMHQLGLSETASEATSMAAHETTNVDASGAASLATSMEPCEDIRTAASMEASGEAKVAASVAASFMPGCIKPPPSRTYQTEIVPTPQV